MTELCTASRDAPIVVAVALAGCATDGRAPPASDGPHDAVIAHDLALALALVLPPRRTTLQLSRDTTWTLEREARHGQFAGTSFHDGQGFMVPRNADARSALELDGARLCVVRGSVWARNAEEFFTLGGLDYRPVVTANEDDTFARYVRGDCDAVTADRSRLGARRVSRACRSGRAPARGG